MPDRERKVLELYLEHRVRDQVNKFYKPRREEYLRAYRQSLVIKAVLLALGGIAGILAGINLGGNRPIWAVAAAAFPALSTALVAYDGMFSFDRLAKTYGDVVDSIALLDEPTEAEVAADASALTEYVTVAEGVFFTEHGYWGKLMRDTQAVAPPSAKE